MESYTVHNSYKHHATTGQRAKSGCAKSTIFLRGVGSTNLLWQTRVGRSTAIVELVVAPLGSWGLGMSEPCWLSCRPPRPTNQLTCLSRLLTPHLKGVDLHWGEEKRVHVTECTLKLWIAVKSRCMLDSAAIASQWEQESAALSRYFTLTLSLFNIWRETDLGWIVIRVEKCPNCFGCLHFYVCCNLPRFHPTLRLQWLISWALFFALRPPFQRNME